MRAISPIVSAVILLMAALAAGAIIYQYFMGTIRTVTDKPMFYAYDAQYLPDLGVIYVTADNNGNYPVNVTAAQIDCSSGVQAKVPLGVVINAGSTETIRIKPPATCQPVVVILSYTYVGKNYTTDPIRIS